MDVHTDRLNINGDWKLPEKDFTIGLVSSKM